MAGQGPNTIVAAIHSDETQQPSTTDPTLITFNHHDFLNRVQHSTVDNPGEIKVLEDGWYMIHGIFHIFKTAGGLDRNMIVFLRKNISNVDHSAIDTNLKDLDLHPQMHFIHIIELKKDDKLYFYQKISQTGIGMGLRFDAATSEVPDIPSAKILLFKID